MVRGLFALFDARTRGAFSREYELINRIQWESPERVHDLQVARLRELLVHAERHVPFYRRRFAEHGIRAAELRDLTDLPRFPLLTKAEVLAQGDSMVSEIAPRGLVRKATGGSTGERVVFYRRDRKSVV